MEQILKTVSKAQSPVKGEEWPALSKEYKALKKKEGGSNKADLELSGTMLDALDYQKTKDGIQIGFFTKEAWKADGHLKFSGKENNIPQRRFLPAEGQSFTNEIMTGAERIILDALASNQVLSDEDLQTISSKTDLYSYLGEKLGLDSRPEIKLTILRNPQMADLLDKYGLLVIL